VRENGEKGFAGLTLSWKMTEITATLAVFVEMPAIMIVDALIILALATLIDAAQSVLYLCHVVQGMQGKNSKYCHSCCFGRNACDNTSGYT
jgi:hypothetical protein